MEVTVVVPYFGEPHTQLAHERAIPSAYATRPAAVIASTGATVAEARNNGLAAVETEWTVFLDADDELAPDYLHAMATGTADVRVPAVEYIQPDGTITPPQLWDTRCAWQRDGGAHDCTCLRSGSWVPVGAMVRTSLAKAVGWQDWPVYEDWDFWLRLHLAGASFEALPRAVYRAHVRQGSRNRSLTRYDRAVVHDQIAKAAGIETAEHIMRYLRPSPRR